MRLSCISSQLNNMTADCHPQRNDPSFWTYVVLAIRAAHISVDMRCMLECAERYLWGTLEGVLHRHVMPQKCGRRGYPLLPGCGSPSASHAAQHPFHHLCMA